MFSVMEDESVVTSNHRVNQQTWQHFLDPSLSIVYSKLCIGGHYNKYGLYHLSIQLSSVPIMRRNTSCTLTDFKWAQSFH